MAKASAAESMLPEDSNDPAYDVSELRVNFSDKEQSSEARDYTAMPSGKYRCAITDWEVRRSNSQKHNGKPYWALTLTVQEGKYEGRKLWANVMLFEGALFSYVQLAKALGGDFAESLKTGKIPHGDNLQGKEVVAVVVKKIDKYKIEQGEWDENSGDPKPMKNEVSGFQSIGAGASTASGGSGSLMP